MRDIANFNTVDKVRSPFNLCPGDRPRKFGSQLFLFCISFVCCLKCPYRWRRRMPTVEKQCKTTKRKEKSATVIRKMYRFTEKDEIPKFNVYLLSQHPALLELAVFPYLFIKYVVFKSARTSTG